MPAPNLPAIYDPLNPLIQAQPWLARDAFNTVNGVQGIALDEAQHTIEPTAEGTNGERACIKSFCDYVQGLTPITALQIDSFFRPPVYTTAALPAATTGEARVVYDTTTNRLKSSNGSTWDQYLASGDVSPGVGFFAEGGGIDDTASQLTLHEDHFAVTDAGGGSFAIELGEVPASLVTGHQALRPDLHLYLSGDVATALVYLNFNQPTTSGTIAVNYTSWLAPYACTLIDVVLYLLDTDYGSTTVGAHINENATPAVTATQTWTADTTQTWTLNQAIAAGERLHISMDPQFSGGHFSGYARIRAT